MIIPTINENRLLNFIKEMAEIGATPLGGCNRQALTEEDREGRELFISWCKKINGTPRLDTMGNLFIRFEGKNPELAPILIGSHLDTQPTGGKYDGVYGVLAGVEVMSTLHDQQYSLEYPVDLVVWSNEEGARFSPAMSGSGVFAGKLDQEQIYRSQDDNGICYLEALKATNQLGSIPCRAFPFTASLELHIEQGPILEASHKPVGVVTGVQGMNWYQITIHGETTHAGPTPMSMRKDPVQGLYPLLQQIYAKVEEFGEDARITIGKINTVPSSPNTVPKEVTFTLDIRHPEQAQLDSMSAQVLALCESGTELLSVSIQELWQSPAVHFSSRCIDAIQSACNQLDIDSMNIVSGAGHDSVYLSHVGPTGMIFVPCTKGISHNELEHVEPEYLIAGTNVLLNSLINLSQ